MSRTRIEVSFLLDIVKDSELYKLVQEASRIGVPVMKYINAKRRVPKLLRERYEEANRKLKVAILADTQLAFPIENMQWDTDAFLSKEEHEFLLAPEG